MTRLITLDEFDAVVAGAEALLPTDYARGIATLHDVAVRLQPPGTVVDPFGPDYAGWVMQTYCRIAGVDRYAPEAHEADTNVPVDLPLAEFFPFSTRDLSLIGRYIAGVGLVLSSLDLPPQSRVVEYGVGWGHVSAALARAGHRVTCVDVEPKFLVLAQRQAESLGCRVDVHHGAFTDTPFPPEAARADAAVFFEAFHHAFDHQAVLRRLRQDVLRPGGVLLLAAEPVHPDFPVPWGVRPDGHALWAVRRHKWMELGFAEGYLVAALLREGFLVARTSIEALGSFGLIYRARLHEGTVEPGDTIWPTEDAASWAPPLGTERHLWAQLDSRATLDQSTSWTGLSVLLRNHLTKPLEVALDAGGAGPAVRHRLAPGEATEVRLPLPQEGRQLRVWSETAVPAVLGMGDDPRSLGVAVERLRYHAG